MSELPDVDSAPDARGAPKPAQAFLATVAVLVVAVPAFVVVGIALELTAGATLFGPPSSPADAWWYDSASFAYLAAGAASTVAAFVLSRRRMRYALLPFVPTIALTAVLVTASVVSS